MLSLGKSHPAILAATTRILKGENVVPFTVVRDLDSVEYYISVRFRKPVEGEDAAATPSVAKHADAAQLGSAKTDEKVTSEDIACRPATITIGVRHPISFAQLNAYGNFEVDVRGIFPKAYERYLSGFGVTRTFPPVEALTTGAGACSTTHTSQSVCYAVEVTIPDTVPFATQKVIITDYCAQFRSMCFYPVFNAHMETFLLKTGGEAAATGDLPRPVKLFPVKPMQLPYHPIGEESMFLYTSTGASGSSGSVGAGAATPAKSTGSAAAPTASANSNFMVCIEIKAESKDERTFLKHFLQTFMDAKKLQKELSGSPGFMFFHGHKPYDAPALTFVHDGDQNYFFVSFQLFKLHMTTPERRLQAIQQLINFRSFVWFHIHACRSYMHGLMRARVETSLQVLNRAKTKTTGKARASLE